MIRDSRINQVGALVDDARTLLGDLAEEGWRELEIARARKHLNAAIVSINRLQGRTGDDYVGPA